MKKDQANVLTIDWDCFFTADLIDQYCTACSWNYTCSCSSSLLCARRYSRPLLQPPNNHYQQVQYRAGGTPLELLFSLGELPPRMAGAGLVVMDCHADLYRLLGHGSSVINIDSHADIWHWGFFRGDGVAVVNCASWAGYGLETGRVSHYQWIRNFSAVESWTNELGELLCEAPSTTSWPDHFDLVALCWSRPWTPATEDGAFRTFINQTSQLTKTSPSLVGSGRSRIRRLLEKGPRHENETGAEETASRNA